MATDSVRIKVEIDYRQISAVLSQLSDAAQSISDTLLQARDALDEQAAAAEPEDDI